LTAPCPLCGQPLYGWVTLPAASREASVGMPLGARDDEERVLERCESCGVALERGRTVELEAEWEAICHPAPGGGREIAIPNRASLQASIGAGGWAAIDLAPGRLLLTPKSLELLAERNGQRLKATGFPPLGRTQVWMWQTLLNGLTFHANFAREAWAGRLRPATGGGRLKFAVDVVVTALAAPLVALLSIPLELVAALARRGGEIHARTG
jgi:hypothetical protein